MIAWVWSPAQDALHVLAAAGHPAPTWLRAAAIREDAQLVALGNGVLTWSPDRAPTGHAGFETAAHPQP